MGVDILIGMNIKVLSGWFGNKISAGQSGRVLLLGHLGQFCFFNTKGIYLFISLFPYPFRFPLTNLFIYLFT